MGNPQWKRGSHVRVHSVVVGDFNAKVGRKELVDEEAIGNYGTGQRNERGQLLINMCEEENVKIANTFYKKRIGRKWTWIAPNNTSKNCIDFVLMKDMSICKDIDIVNNVNFRTDHRMIRVRIRIEDGNRRKPHYQPKRQKMEINKTTFKRHLNTEMERQHISSFKSSYKTISRILGDAAKQSMEPTITTPRFSARTIHLFDERRKLIGKNDLASRLNLITTNKQLRYQIGEDLQLRYEAIVEKAIRSQRSLKKTLIKNKASTPQAVSLRMGNGQLSTTQKETEEVVQEFYNSLYKSTTTNPPAIQLTMAPFDAWITEAEVRKYLHLMKKGTSPGEDKITVELLVDGEDMVIPMLTRMYNECLDRGEIPEDFANSITSILFKKGDQHDIRNYRPISLLSCIYKLFTKLLNYRMEDALDAAQSIDQAGFRKNYSTLDDIHSLKLLIRNAREYKFPLYIVFVDYEKAFDSIEFHAVWQALLNHGIHPIYVRILRRIYEIGRSEIKVNNGRVQIEINRGVRQGDTISPKLFTACVEEIFRRMNWNNCGVDINGSRMTNLRFAGDLAIISHDYDEVQEMLQQLNQKSNEIGLKINRRKTVAMTNAPPFTISLDGEELEYADSFIYLGHIISMGEGDGREIDRRVKAGWNSIRPYKSFLKSKRVPMRYKRKLFNQCTLPAMLYGCETWALRREDREKLRRAQRRMERMMIGINILDRWRNERVRGVTKVVDVVKEATERKWNWTRTTLNKNDGRWTKRMINWTPTGWMNNRERGRPPMRWADEFKKLCGHNWKTLATTNERRWKIHIRSQQEIV